MKKITRHKTSPATSETGFTLIEMLIVMAIMGIAVLIALPNYLVWQSRAELRQAITEVQNQLLLARMAALSRNAPVTVAISITNGAVRTTTTNAATGAIDYWLLQRAAAPCRGSESWSVRRVDISRDSERVV